MVTFFPIVQHQKGMYKLIMVTLDKELAEDLVETTKQIVAELSEIVEQLKDDPSKRNLYEKYGQAMDRIYGTVVTLGMKNFAEYTKLLKEIGYACSQSDMKLGRARTIGLMESSIQNLDAFREFIVNPQDSNKLKTFRLILEQEKAKAKSLATTIFRITHKRSTDK